MSSTATFDRWLKKTVEQLSEIDGVEHDTLNDGTINFKISYNGVSHEMQLDGSASEIRIQKDQFSQIRDTLTNLGIIEGQTYVAPKRSRKPMSPDMAAARARQQKEFQDWQEVWRIVRKAEVSLDREYEISNMLDYY
jgi:hypothetical protein